MGWSTPATREFFAARQTKKLAGPEHTAERLTAWLEEHLHGREAFSTGIALVRQTKGRPKLLLLSDDELAVVDVDDETGAVSTEYYAPCGGVYEERFNETEAGLELRVSYKCAPPSVRITESFRHDALGSEQASRLRTTLRRWASNPPRSRIAPPPAPSPGSVLEQPPHRQTIPLPGSAQTFRAEASHGSSTH